MLCCLCHSLGNRVYSLLSMNKCSVLYMYFGCTLHFIRYRKLFSFQNATCVGSWNAHLPSVLGVEERRIPPGASTLYISFMVCSLSLRCSIASCALITHTVLSHKGRLFSRSAVMSQFAISILLYHGAGSIPQHKSILSRLFFSARFSAIL